MSPRRAVVSLSVCALATSAVVAAIAPASADPVNAAAAARSLHTVTVKVPASLRTAPFNVPHTLNVPSGWTAAVWARVPGARMALWMPDNSLLVSGNGQVVRLKKQADPNAVPPKTVLLSGLSDPQGLAFDRSRGTLYVGESTQVEAFTYSSGTLTNRRTVLGNLPSGGHDAKGLVVGPDHAVYVTVGSSDNTSAGDRTANPERAAIYRIPPTGGAATAFAHGVRNGTGLSVDPNGAVWTAVNNRDNIAYPWHRDYDGNGSDDYGQVMPNYVNDHPAEEVAKLTAGRDLGWPYCNPDPDANPGVAGTALRYGKMPYVPDAQLNPNNSVLDCTELKPIERGLPAHSAPLGFHFVTGSTLPAAWRTGAVVGVHGSWNRTPPQPPSVQFMPWTGGTLGAAVPMVTGFQLADGSRWARSVDAVPGPDGALYVTDDQSGTVYRIAPRA